MFFELKNFFANLIAVSQASTQCKPINGNLYYTSCDVQQTAIPTANTPQSAGFDIFSLSNIEGVALTDTIVVYTSIFTFVWTLFYFAVSVYLFNYKSLTSESKKYKNEFDGYNNRKTAYRLILTLLCFQIPIVSYYLVALSGEPVFKILTLLIFVIPCLLIKLFLDATCVPFYTDLFFKDYKDKKVSEQLYQLLIKKDKKPADSKPKVDSKSGDNAGTPAKPATSSANPLSPINNIIDGIFKSPNK